MPDPSTCERCGRVLAVDHQSQSSGVICYADYWNPLTPEDSEARWGCDVATIARLEREKGELRAALAGTIDERDTASARIAALEAGIRRNAGCHLAPSDGGWTLYDWARALLGEGD